MARLFSPAVSCPACSYPNDHTFRFCQSCGYSRRYLLPPRPKAVSFDLQAIDQRIQDLQQRNSSTAYAKQKASLKGELESFLVYRFLVFKDAKAKTQPHKNGCPHTGKKGLFSCGCPRRLAYSTLDSYIGKLRSIFAEAGRQGDWNRTLLPGNPATDDLVKIYLKQVTVEQLLARVTPKQAVPFFPDKLLQLSNHLKRRLAPPTLNTSEQFVTALDQAFFKTLFYSGDRAGNLGQVKTAEIARFPR